jgi:hypothetical protein
MTGGTRVVTSAMLLWVAAAGGVMAQRAAVIVQPGERAFVSLLFSWRAT